MRLLVPCVKILDTNVFFLVIYNCFSVSVYSWGAIPFRLEIEQADWLKLSWTAGGYFVRGFSAVHVRAVQGIKHTDSTRRACSCMRTRAGSADRPIPSASVQSRAEPDSCGSARSIRGSAGLARTSMRPQLRIARPGIQHSMLPCPAWCFAWVIGVVAQVFVDRGGGLAFFTTTVCDRAHDHQPSLILSCDL